jgi:hypothetical protein
MSRNHLCILCRERLELDPNPHVKILRSDLAWNQRGLLDIFVTVNTLLPLWSLLLAAHSATNWPLALFLRASTFYHDAPIGKNSLNRKGHPIRSGHF